MLFLTVGGVNLSPGISRLLDEIETEFQQLPLLFSKSTIPMELVVQMPDATKKCDIQDGGLKTSSSNISTCRPIHQLNLNAYSYVFDIQLVTLVAMMYERIGRNRKWNMQATWSPVNFDLSVYRDCNAISTVILYVINVQLSNGTSGKDV